MDGVQDHCDEEDTAEDLGSIRDSGALEGTFGEKGGDGTMLTCFVEHQRESHQEAQEDVVSEIPPGQSTAR